MTEAAENIEPTAATPKSARRRRASTGGFKQKLQAPERKGYVRRWVNDEPGRIQAMQELGYDFAKADTPTDGMGTRITRHAGKSEGGAAMQTFLMECRADDYELGVREKEEALKPFEEAIRRGDDTTGKLEDGYAPRTSGKSTINHSR